MFTTPVPALRLPKESIDPEAAYRFIHDELMLDCSVRFNRATFVTTWMESQGREIDGRDVRQNMIEKDKYPVIATIEQRCVCMVADLIFTSRGSATMIRPALRGLILRPSTRTSSAPQLSSAPTCTDELQSVAKIGAAFDKLTADGDVDAPVHTSMPPAGAS